MRDTWIWRKPCIASHVLERKLDPSNGYCMVTALGGSTEEPANGVPEILRCHGSALTIERSRQAVFRSLNRDAIVLGQRRVALQVGGQT